MLYYADICQGLKAPEGREYFALLIAAELGDRIRELPTEDVERLEQWIRNDLELAGHLVPDFVGQANL